MNLIYGIKDKPKFGQIILFAIQQLLAIMAATIAVPAVINSACGSAMTASAALFGAGLGTFVYLLFTKSSSPVFLGSSFAFIGSMCSAFGGAASMAAGYWGLIIGVIIGVVVLCGGGAAVFIFLRKGKNNGEEAVEAEKACKLGTSLTNLKRFITKDTLMNVWRKLCAICVKLVKGAKEGLAKIDLTPVKAKISGLLEKGKARIKAPKSKAEEPASAEPAEEAEEVTSE